MRRAVIPRIYAIARGTGVRCDLRPRIACGTRPAAAGTQGAVQSGMQALILMSVLIATFAIPVLAVRRSDRSIFGRVVGASFAFTGVYVFLVVFVYPRLF